MGAVTASPTTYWTVGQHVVLGDATKAFWNGTAWQSGQSNLATGATAGTPGSFTPAGSTARPNLTQMTGCTASPATVWTVGQYVVLGDLTHAHWTGSAWATGDAP
jgi:hypothetical protein